jgi:hypothetical protein
MVCSDTKICDKWIFFVDCVIKREKCPVRNYVGAPKIISFTQFTKNITFSLNFVNGYRMSGYTSKKNSNLFNILNFFFLDSYEPLNGINRGSMIVGEVQ